MMNPIQEILSDLDRRDPNRYEVPVWAIVGKHDCAWPGSPVYRKIRASRGAGEAR